MLEKLVGSTHCFEGQWMHVSGDVECHGDVVFLNVDASSHSQIASNYDPEKTLQLQTSCRKTNTSTIVCTVW